MGKAEGPSAAPRLLQLQPQGMCNFKTCVASRLLWFFLGLGGFVQKEFCWSFSVKFRRKACKALFLSRFGRLPQVGVEYQAMICVECVPGCMRSSRTEQRDEL